MQREEFNKRRQPLTPPDSPPRLIEPLKGKVAPAWKSDPLYIFCGGLTFKPAEDVISVRSSVPPRALSPVTDGLPGSPMRHAAPSPGRLRNPKPIKSRDHWVPSPAVPRLPSGSWNAEHIKNFCTIFRGFEEAIPDPIPGERLTLQQACAYLKCDKDIQEIVTALPLLHSLGSMRYKWSPTLRTWLITRLR